MSPKRVRIIHIRRESFIASPHDWILNNRWAATWNVPSRCWSSPRHIQPVGPGKVNGHCHYHGNGDLLGSSDLKGTRYKSRFVGFKIDIIDGRVLGISVNIPTKTFCPPM